MTRPGDHIDPQRLIDYEFERLDAEMRAQVDQHLEGCGACRAEKALAREYASTPINANLGDRSQRMTASFEQQVATTAGARPVSRGGPKATPRSPRPTRSQKWATGLLVAGLALITVGVLQMQRNQTPSNLGQTLRSDPSGKAVELDVTSTDEGWTLRWQADDVRYSSIVVTTSKGKVAFESTDAVSPLRLSREDLGASDNDLLFVQLITADALGREERSTPLELN